MCNFRKKTLRYLNRKERHQSFGGILKNQRRYGCHQRFIAYNCPVWITYGRERLSTKYQIQSKCSVKRKKKTLKEGWEVEWNQEMLGPWGRERGALGIDVEVRTKVRCSRVQRQPELWQAFGIPVNTPVSMPSSYFRVPAFKSAPYSSFLVLCTLGMSSDGSSSWVLATPAEDQDWVSGLWLMSWPSSGCQGHLGSEPTYGSLLSI